MHIGKGLAAVLIIILIIVIYAWIDGGEETMQTIEQPVVLTPAPER